MDKQDLSVLKNQFDTIVHDMDENIEFWYARELQELLGYKRWENFETAIKKAMTSCETTGVAVMDHFRGVTKMIELGKGAKRPVCK